MPSYRIGYFKMIFDLKNITDAFGNITGIIHVGAFRGEEIKQYREIGLKNTILFEPQEHLYYMFKYQLLPTEQAYNFALGDEEGELDLYISKTEGGTNVYLQYKFVTVVMH